MESSKGIKNIIAGLLANFLTFAVGLIIPRLVLVNLGSEANGLLNSVGSILGYLSLLEAGVGTASLNALYKPCANKDRDAINSIMAATDYFYNRTGKIYLFLVVLLSIGYTLLVQTELPQVDVFLVVLLCGLSGVGSYFFQGKFKLYLAAEGKSYISTNIGTFIQIATSITKAILLYVGFGVVEIQFAAFALNVIQIIFFLYYMRKHYAWIDLKVKPNLDAINQKNAVLIHQIAALIFNNTDVLLLTIFTSLKEVSVYSMYAMIYGMVKWLAVVLYESYTFVLGQSYNTDRARFLKMFDAYEICTMMITFSLYCICRALINPFLSLYTSGVNDIQYVDKYLPWLFAAFYVLHNGRTSSATLINIAQHFERTKWRAVVEAIINVTISVICINIFGIYGVLLGTVAALFYRSNDMIIYAARILDRSCLITYKRWIINLVVFAFCSAIINLFTIPAENYLQLFCSACIVSLFVISVFILANIIMEKENMKYLASVAKNIIRGSLQKLKRA